MELKTVQNLWTAAAGCICDASMQDKLSEDW